MAKKGKLTVSIKKMNRAGTIDPNVPPTVVTTQGEATLFMYSGEIKKGLELLQDFIARRNDDRLRKIRR